MENNRLKIREISKVEIPDAIKISRIIFNSTDDNDKYHTQSLWEEKLNRDGILLGAYLDGVLIGYKFGYREDSETFHSWMGGVLEEYRGQKVATELLHFQEKLLQSRGYKYVTVNTVKSKYPNMFNFLLKQGYIVESTSEQKELDGSVVTKSSFKRAL
jgi:predicted GNAT superfamily acetyltransferase